MVAFADFIGQINPEARKRCNYDVPFLVFSSRGAGDRTAGSRKCAADRVLTLCWSKVLLCCRPTVVLDSHSHRC